MFKATLKNYSFWRIGAKDLYTTGLSYRLPPVIAGFVCTDIWRCS